MHAGLLADVRLESHRDQLAELGIEPFELLISNLYPFTETVASGASPDECIEQIDIGGPSMVRGAAKNHACVAVVTSPGQYDDLREALAAGGFTLAQRQALAAAAFVHTATYDVAVASWLGNVVTDTSGGTGFPSWIGATWDRAAVLRYGENPHQRAALYRNGFLPGGLATAEQLHGKEMSYNNYVDTDAARRAAYDFDEPAVAIIKHANPCGIAIGADIADGARQGARLRPGVGVRRGDRDQPTGQRGDGRAGRGGVHRGDRRPRRTRTARSRCWHAKKNIRILVVEPRPPRRCGDPADRRRAADAAAATRSTPTTTRPRTGSWWPASRLSRRRILADLEFAWKAVRSVKSNAILLASDGASVGVGMGQVNRVDSCRLAVERAGDRARARWRPRTRSSRSPTGREILLDAGVAAIVQPGGSVRDAEVIEAVTGRGADHVRHRCAALLPLTIQREGDTMTAQILDGKALAATIKAELTERVAKLAERRDRARAGHRAGRRRPRQPVLRRRQAPRLRPGRHRLDPGRAAGRHQRRRARGPDRRAERRPGLHRLHRPAAAARQLDDNWALGLVDPDKDADGLHPTNLGRLVLGEPGPLPCTPTGIVELLRRNGIAIAAPRSA